MKGGTTKQWCQNEAALNWRDSSRALRLFLAIHSCNYSCQRVTFFGLSRGLFSATVTSEWSADKRRAIEYYTLDRVSGASRQGICLGPHHTLMPRAPRGLRTGLTVDMQFVLYAHHWLNFSFCCIFVINRTKQADFFFNSSTILRSVSSVRHYLFSFSLRTYGNHINLSLKYFVCVQLF